MAFVHGRIFWKPHTCQGSCQSLALELVASGSVERPRLHDDFILTPVLPHLDHLKLKLPSFKKLEVFFDSMVLALAHFAQHNSDLKGDEIVLTIFFNECSYCLQEALHPKVDVVHLYFTKIMPRCPPAFPPSRL